MPNQFNFDCLPVDELWNIYHDIRGVLTDKLSEQKRDLDNRLRSLSQQDLGSMAPARATQAKPTLPIAKDGTRRTYPKVMPLYRNPSEPSETWSGRGNKPRWLAAQVNAGRDIADFLISPVGTRAALKRKTGRKNKAR